jgi:hypothetical protein
VLIATFPASQVLHTVAPDVAESQYVPSGQLPQAESPVMAYCPSPQNRHEDCPERVVTCGDVHAVHVVTEPDELKVPAEHAVHPLFWLEVDEHAVDWYSPALQTLHAVHCLLVVGVHATDWYSPDAHTALHAVQEVT